MSLSAIEQGEAMILTSTKRAPGQAPAVSRLGLVAKARRGVARYASDLRGVISIEMALIFPLMLILFVGLVDAGNMLTANRRVALTAGTIGDLVGQAPGQVTPAQLEGFFSAAAPIMDPFPAASTSLELYNYTMENGVAKGVWKHTRGGGCGGPPVLDQDDLALLMAEGNDVVVSRTCYIWQPVLGIMLGFKQTVLENQFMVRPRQSAKMICTACQKF
jgi:hypothetical protein